MPPRKIRPDTPDHEAPEADAAWFEQARPATDVLPDLVGSVAAAELLKPRRGRPRAAAPKAHVNIRLDADFVQAFKSTGAGWQTRLNQALRDWPAKRCGRDSAVSSRRRWSGLDPMIVVRDMALTVRRVPLMA